ncbi:MAG: Biotin biosynthesis cytochrome [Nocardia sp.]|uniref:cytochrome P450 family protein n=1 Tax=Nocardia sp. TaxID=1821 RepID=UPI0026182E22|nr:cytochrome P450 [Nocardia sp.]MCU1645743.1 Biotin biosynthesis cytochrome [Nocardia sp.]
MVYDSACPAAGLTTEPFDLTEGLFGDRHGSYDELRGRGPVHLVRFPDLSTGWLITDYEVAKAAFLDPAISKVIGSPGARAAVTANGGGQHLPNGMFKNMLVFYDPPEHTRLRTLVNRAFNGRAIRGLAPRITEVADELLAGLAADDNGVVDLLESYATPLPMTVICELLGVPAEDRDNFRAWSAIVVASEYPNDARMAAVQEFVAYIDQLIRVKTNSPGSDLLSELIAASEDDDRLSHRELISMVFVLLVAGFETAVNLIGNSVAQLLGDESSRLLLRSDPGRIPDFLEEMLRYEAPATEATFRYTTAPVTLGGIEIPAEQLIIISMAAAGRDPQRFSDPHRFDIDRPDNQHIAFGHGIHRCVGAPLARMEGDIALTRLLRKFPDLKLAPGFEPEWHKSLIVRGLTSIPVLI